jgi:hypothetical protein
MTIRAAPKFFPKVRVCWQAFSYTAMKRLSKISGLLLLTGLEMRGVFIGFVSYGYLHPVKEYRKELEYGVLYPFLRALVPHRVAAIR